MLLIVTTLAVPAGSSSRMLCRSVGLCHGRTGEQPGGAKESGNTNPSLTTLAAPVTLTSVSEAATMTFSSTDPASSSSEYVAVQGGAPWITAGAELAWTATADAAVGDTRHVTTVAASASLAPTPIRPLSTQ